MNILHTLESQFGFTYPPLYHQLYGDGMLSYGAGAEALLENPPLLFWADFEIVLPEQVAAAREEFYAPVNYRDVPKNMNLIPFGMNGAGDLYCFNGTHTKSGNLPIVLAAHDSSTITLLTNDLQAFIYQMLVEMVETLERDSPIMANLRVNLDNMLKTHGRYLTEGQLQELSKLTNQIFIS